MTFGVELSFPLWKKLGRTTLAYDCHMYEEGKIIFDRGRKGEREPEASFHYDKDAPWQTDHAIVLNQPLNDSLSLEASWHGGRSPFHTFWYVEHPQWFSVGVRYNPDPTVTLYDSEKR